MDETDPNEAAVTLIRSAVDGDAKSMRQLVRDLTPVIHAGVAWALARGHVPARRERFQELEDVTQMVLLTLFADRGRALLQWDPSRGMDLRSFVALLARRETMSVLRSPRRSPWTEDPTLLEDLDLNAMPRMGPESEAISRDMLSALSIAMRERLSPRGAEVFDLMFLEGRTHEETCDKTGLTPDAVYAWKSRIAKQLRELFTALARAPSTIPPPDDRHSPLHALPPAPKSRPSSPSSGAPVVASRRAPEQGETRPITGTIAKVSRVRDPERTKTGPVAPRSIPRTIPRAQGMRARAGASSSTPPPPSER